MMVEKDYENEDEDEEVVQLTTNDSSSSDNSVKDKRPAVFWTATHHARELITIQMSLYSILKLVHEALV